ncbi:MAG: hypothetical protein C4520_18825 [Candidatus Abyssobacteria bacterium SURF_5]|uniref:TRASH domain-containing protein n=1 Tax=Abyssobacteria bacterium (strain SURF_5) TaxID=2093360 RepID=A0A3A4NLL4_ABYX5|nr:MAG: hypothetical protein C4520_18825 [Candidatus Abyssubacteria bacterium SURF_5]
MLLDSAMALNLLIRFTIMTKRRIRGVFIPYCQCADLDDFENMKTVLIRNGQLRRTVLFCCEKCFEKFFGKK